jgi:hypothetical protein
MPKPNRPASYIGKRRVRQLRHQLSSKTLKVLETIIVHKAMLTNQITRICIGEKNDNNARTSMRILNKLLGAELVRANSYTTKFDGYAITTWSWEPTNLGIHVGAPHDLRTPDGKPKYLISDENTQADKLEHVLQITETEAILRDQARANADFTIHHIEHEPVCWRKYADRRSGENWLKLDLFLKTAHKVNGKKLGMHYFLEIDRDTEELKRIMKKCDIYRDYFRNTPKDQLCCGKIPLVVWIVPAKRRADAMKAIWEEKFRDDAKLFAVITPDKVANFFTNWQFDGDSDE